MNQSSAMRFHEENGKHTLLIINEDSPKSYSPAGERILYTTLASSFFFERVIMLSLGGRKQSRQRQKKYEHNSKVLLYTVNFVRAALYPFSALFDPIKFLVLLFHSFILSKRYKPLFIVASMPPLEVGLSAWLLTKRKIVKLIIDLRDDWESARCAQLSRYFPAAVFKVLLMVVNKIYSSAFVIFTATQTIADTVRRRGVVTQTILAPNGADTSVFVPRNQSLRVKTRTKYNLPLDKVIAVYCGSGTSPYYRLDQVLASVRFLPQGVKDRVYIVFYVYDGSKKLQRLQKELGISGNVLEIRDPLPRKSLAEVLAACDVGLLPFDEAEYLLCARSTKLYEYLSSGLYAITSGPAGGELDELFSTNPALGSFIRPSAENFAVSLSQLLKSRETLFSDDSRKLRHAFIKKNYDRLDTMKTAMRALLERVKSNNTVTCIRNRDIK